MKGEETITIEALWDPGSESSFFSAALLPFALSQRDQSFKIETLSPSATKPEIIHGVEAVFQVAVPGGETVNLRLLQHSGLENRQMKLKPKLVTCSAEFANKYDLKQTKLSEPCSSGQYCVRQPKRRLSVVLGMDIFNIRPKLIDEYSDMHGCMSLYACPLSAKLILCGNRIYPYTPAQAREALAQHTNSFGVITEEAEEEDLSLPTTSLFHGALEESRPIATWVGPKEPALCFLEDEKDNLSVTYA